MALTQTDTQAGAVVSANAFLMLPNDEVGACAQDVHWYRKQQAHGMCA